MDREELKLAVWKKGKKIPDCDPDVWRYDDMGKLIRFTDHGDRDSEFGWEIDHIVPRARKGSDALSNLRSLNWKDNAERGAGTR